MLAVFASPQLSPVSPVGTKRRRIEHNSLSPEEEEYVSGVLDGLASSLPRRSHAYITEHYPGGGANGIAFVQSLAHALAVDREGDVVVFLSGALEGSPAEGQDAEFILQEYHRCFDSGAAALGGGAPTMEALAQLKGPFAFLIYDRCHGRVVAARDPAGREPLAWGTSTLSEGLLFASDRGLLDAECADAADFPPGTVFVSEDFSTVGTLTPMSLEGTAADAADAAEAAQQQEALCRVESEGLPRVGSASEVAAG